MAGDCVCIVHSAGKFRDWQHVPGKQRRCSGQHPGPRSLRGLVGHRQRGRRGGDGRPGGSGDPGRDQADRRVHRAVGAGNVRVLPAGRPGHPCPPRRPDP